jgi:prefoldin alpha subunit
MQENYQELMQLQQNMQMFERYLEEIEMQAQELERIKIAIEDFSKTKKGTETLVPIANGIFFKAKIDDNTKFIVNIGAEGTVVEMNIDEASELILKQIETTKENHISITNELNALIEKFKEFE